jgi:hypothetical protein
MGVRMAWRGEDGLRPTPFVSATWTDHIAGEPVGLCFGHHKIKQALLFQKKETKNFCFPAVVLGTT